MEWCVEAVCELISAKLALKLRVYLDVSWRDVEEGARSRLLSYMERGLAICVV